MILAAFAAASMPIASAATLLKKRPAPRAKAKPAPKRVRKKPAARPAQRHAIPKPKRPSISQKRTMRIQPPVSQEPNLSVANL